MKNLCIPLALVFVLACGAAPHALAQPSAASQNLLQRVDNHYNRLRTLRARFTEHYTGMGMDRTESGTLALKKPGLMRWSYDKPTGKVFVLDGHYAWFYSPGDARVSRMPVKQLDDLRSPLRLLLGHTQLAKELTQVTVAPDGANFRITGVPRGMEQRVRLLTLVVTPAGVIQNMKIEETDGATTGFTFSGIEENIPLPSSEFVFTPPQGVPIVDGQSPI